jgi:hypothetical protein
MSPADLNLALRFLVELIGIGAVAFWGLTAFETLVVKLLLGLGAPVVLIAAWATLVAPNSDGPLTQLQRVLLGTALLELAAAAFFLAGQREAAVIYGVVVAVNAGLMVALGQVGMTG